MRLRFGSLGPQALTLLAVTGAFGVVLALHGWAHHTAGGALGSLGAGSAASVAAPSTSAQSAASSSAAATAGPSALAGAAARAPGPLLKSQPFAQYAFAIWPGTPGGAAKAALTGLSVSVRHQTSGLSITAAVNGQSAGPAHFYPNGARVYVVEAAMGDDSGSSDYNLGDDGIVVTDAQGRIVS